MIALLAFMLSFSLSAYEFEVAKKMELVPKARSVTKMDFNDRICTRIMINTDIDGVTFETNRGITEVSYNAKKKYYDLYLPQGASSMSFDHSKFATYYYDLTGIELKAGSTYQLSIVKKANTKDPDTFDKNKGKFILKSLEKDILSMAAREREGEGCKAAIILITDLSRETVVDGLFNKEMVFPVKREGNRTICTNNKAASFRSILNNKLPKERIVMNTTFPADMVLEKSMTYELKIGW